MALTIALIHMKMKLLTKKVNLEKARKLTKEAASRGARIVVLPAFVNSSPFFLYYPQKRSRNIARNHAERIPSTTSEYIAKMASENGVFIIAGPVIERAGPRLFLTTLVVAPNGEILAKYRKLAINGMDESLGISNGRQVYVLEQTGRPLGIMSEDDLYYPEVARSLILSGATAIIASLRIGDPLEKIKAMLLARSIENNVPILAVGGALEAPDKYVETPTIVVDPQKGIVDMVKDEIDNYLLVQINEKPENIDQILEIAMRSKYLTQIQYRASRENNVERVVNKIKAAKPEALS